MRWNQLFARKSLEGLLTEAAGDHRLRRALGPVSLSALGVGAILGAGIFVITGRVAREDAGAAVVVSYAISGVGCAWAALCYAEFAAMVPVAGSTYTYAYATLGELAAWVIGWDLILEYAMSCATVASGWSGHFDEFLQAAFSLHLPTRVATDPFTAAGAWVNLPAVLIVAAITAVLVVGIRESAWTNAVLVAVKLVVVLVVVGVGWWYVDPANWTGIPVSARPAADDPSRKWGILSLLGVGRWLAPLDEHVRSLSSLAICTVLYVAVSAVLTGLEPYPRLNERAAVAAAFTELADRQQSGTLRVVAVLISGGALAGITSVLLVTFLSQPRIFLAMARDGLLPPRVFGAVHPRFRTPHVSTMLTGAAVALAAGFTPIRDLQNMVNIGTLLAFILVCAAVLVLRRTRPDVRRPFRCPAVWLLAPLGIGFNFVLMLFLPWETWLRLAAWLGLGLAAYFGYGHRHSTLAGSSAGGRRSEEQLLMSR